MPLSAGAAGGVGGGGGREPAGPRAARRLVLGREGRRVAVGILLIALVLFGQDIVGAATMFVRLDPALNNPTGPSNVIAILTVTPERFHNERLAQYGVFSGRYGAVNRVRLPIVTRKNLPKLA